MRILNILLLASALAAAASASGPLLEANRGQFQAGTQFRAVTGGIAVDIDSSGLEFRSSAGRIGLRFDGARPLQCEPSGARESQSNYLAIPAPIRDVPEYSSIVCRAIYPGIDWIVRSANHTLEHDWLVAPGKDARAISLRFGEQTSAEVEPGGDLLLRSGRLKVVWKAPFAWQMVDGNRRAVASRYVVRRRRIGLDLASYRHDLPLVVDPVIDFSYMVNASGDDRSVQIALDGSGNIYVAGLTTSPDFQTTPGAAFGSPAPSLSGDYRVFVRKLSPDGSKTIYSTYLGLASFNSAHPVGMRVDASGDVYVAVNAFNTAVSGNPIDAGGSVGLYKLDPGGDALIYSTRLFNNLSYAEPVALAIDAAGNAYVGAGSTTVYAAKIDPSGTRRIFAYQVTTGNYPGALADLAAGPDGSVYLAGTQAAMGAAPGLPVTTGVLKPTVANPQDYHGYLIRVKPDGSGPIFSTYIAGDYLDTVTALAVDGSGAAWVGGQTNRDSQFHGIQGAGLGLTQPLSSQAFVMKVTPDGTAATYTALLPNSSVNALAVDGAGQAYTAGPVSGGIAVSKINAAGNQLLYYSVLSTPQNYPPIQPVYGIAVDSAGEAYLAGSTASVQIPDTTQSSGLQPNAFALRMDANPDQADLVLTAQVESNLLLPYAPAHYQFTIHNNGPAAAQDVVLSVAGQQIFSFSNCQASGPGVCGTDPQHPRASFASIPAGGTEQVVLTYPGAGPTLAATVATLASDVDQDNNGATATASFAPTVPVEILSNLGAHYTVTGVSLPHPGASLLNAPISPGAPLYALQGAQVQIFFPSPQAITVGAGTFQSWSDGNTGNPRTFTANSPSLSVRANFALLKTPYTTAQGVVNAGSYAGGGVSPGEVVAIFGLEMGQSGSGQILNGQVTASLNGVTVSFDGVAAPLLAVSPTQVNTIVPYEVAGRATTAITIQNATGSYTTTVPVVAAVPALVSSKASGAGQAAALNQDGSVNSPENPAKPGDLIVLFGTGEGLVSPLPTDGAILPSPAPAPQLPVSVSIGGQPAQIAYAAGAPGEVAGVIQINARIPTGIAYSHHVPVTWSAGNFSSQTGVTIAVQDSPAPAPPYTIGPQDSTLPSIYLSPGQVAADSDATQVTINGSGFVNGMVVRWNGQARPTQFVDSTHLRATLSGNDLETPSLGSLAVWDASQTTQITADTPLLVYLPLINRDLVYDSLRQVVYVAVDAAQQPQGPSIASLDPATGRITRLFPLDAEPTKLALSGDGSFLYVGLGNLIRRIDLSSWTADLDIPLGQDQTSGDREVYSMMTLPSSNTALAVSFFKTGLSPPYLGTAIFDGAQMRPVITRPFEGPLYLIGGPDASTLYGADQQGNFYTLAVDANGVTVGATYPGLLGGDGDSVFAGGLIYDGWGAVVDPTIPAVVVGYDNQGLVSMPAPQSASQSVLILGGVPPPGYLVQNIDPVLSAYSGLSPGRIGSLPLPVSLWSNHGPMFQWGADGVVLREQQADQLTAPGIDLFRIQF